MADKEIGALTAASALDGTELAHIVQGGNSRKLIISTLKTFFGLGGASPTVPSDFKESAYVATTGNITLTGEQTIDGSLTAASRVLVKDQTTGSQNGIYVSAAGAWVRAADADASGDITPGMLILVENGTANGNQVFTCTNSGAITLGSTAIIFQAIAVPQAVFVGKNVNGTTYTHILSDGGKRLEFSNAGTKTFTVAPQSSVSSSVNTAIKLLNVGAGLLTVAPGSGVTINSATALTLLQYQCAILEKRANPNTWVLEFVGGSSAAAGTVEYSMFAGSKPTASEVLFRHEFTAAATIPAGLTASQGSAGIAATASTVLTLKKNTTSIGTATWAAAGTEPTLAAASSTSFAIGDVLSITAPASPDATLADISLSIVGSL